MSTRGIIVKIGRKQRGMIPRSVVRKVVAELYSNSVTSASSSKRSSKALGAKKPTTKAALAK
jgi:hypothetical protein